MAGFFTKTFVARVGTDARDKSLLRCIAFPRIASKELWPNAIGVSQAAIALDGRAFNGLETRIRCAKRAV